MVRAISNGTQTPPAKRLPDTFDVTLGPKEAQLADLDRAAARTDVTLTIPFAKLGLTKHEAKQLVGNAQGFEWLAPGGDGVKPHVSVAKDGLEVAARGVDGRGFLGLAPRLVMKDRDGTVRTITIRTPEVTLREKDPAVRAGWGGAGLKEQRAAENRAWTATKRGFSDQKRELEQEPKSPERKQQLDALKDEQRAAKHTHQHVLEQNRHAQREERHERKQAERDDRRGKVHLTTNQR